MPHAFDLNDWKSTTSPLRHGFLYVDVKHISLCRWFRFAQLAKGKKFRP